MLRSVFFSNGSIFGTVLREATADSSRRGPMAGERRMRRRRHHRPVHKVTLDVDFYAVVTSAERDRHVCAVSGSRDRMLASASRSSITRARSIFFRPTPTQLEWTCFSKRHCQKLLGAARFFSFSFCLFPSSQVQQCKIDFSRAVFYLWPSTAILPI